MKNLLFISLMVLLSGCFQPDEILPKVKDYTTEITVSTKGKQAAYIDLSSADKLANSSESPWHLKFQNTKGAGVSYSIHYYVYLCTIPKTPITML